MFRRRIAFTDQVLQAIGRASAVAVNSFPFDDSRQTDALVAALGMASGLTVVDPNPRPRLIRDMAAYRAGAEKAMTVASLVKLSDEDVDLFYGARRQEAVARLFGLGVDTLLLTHGADGASLHMKSDISVKVGIARQTKPVIDTMGAGDATLATVIAYIVRQGTPRNPEEWRHCLEEAMLVAAATCSSPGGAPRLPEEPVGT